MVKKVFTANRSVAEAVKLAKPEVVPVYPITPQTTISEYLAQFVADGDLKAEYIRVESEHSAISAALGASGAGVRVFSATSSQGLALMHEILFAAAGMRSPIVLVDANRALSAPLSIWNDQQDTISERDSGWLQIYAENAQEALDAVLIAYRVAEDREVLLPCMVCIDGYFLTHTVEPLDVPSQEEVDRFLPPYKPYAFLDPETPMSIGTFTDPEYYMEARYAIEEAMERSKKVITKANKEFAEVFGRKYDFVEPYQCDDAETIIVAMGSVCGTIKDVIDNLRDEGEKVGLLKIRVFRPFPTEELKEILEKASKVAVLDKNISFGMGGVLYNNIKAKTNANAYGFIAGLGGRDITPEYIREMVAKTKNPTHDVEWIGLKKEEV
ncbi:pyruvate synthase subunit PorA [Methanobacterium petrolearium]|uniref:pyruvate synthase subunit PorA n=1 Tax=Methanobacterium petrolearium TaxID=710190 RepID=UPI001AE5839E|nr:pyruvate synthase subunit PorA [Methanobacterium petrolearium]MBP1945975.1 pyruvate ferredoxin oxidoreductase alpha subunit [Methanobacterium petrolearium]BDZ72206.1 2-ketoisovalerate ferredoxin oxidoreductase subunit alpha [Methanobacterium petrolearium]